MGGCTVHSVYLTALLPAEQEQPAGQAGEAGQRVRDGSHPRCAASREEQGGGSRWKVDSERARHAAGY